MEKPYWEGKEYSYFSHKKLNELYEYCISECDKAVPGVQRGVFGADMKIELENDGPFTIVLDSDKL